MKLTPILISILARILVDAEVFEKAKRLVLSLADKNMTSSDKREFVRHELQAAFVGVTDHATNLVIELAVAWMRSKGN